MAEFGSSEAGKRGGEARAKSMTKAERSNVARAAAAARWNKDLPQAICGAEDRPLRIGDIEIPCYVLDDDRRVLIQGGMLRGLNMKQGTAGRGAGDRLAKFISTKSINPFVPKDLADVITHPIIFRTPSGVVAYGYEATVLADLCDAVLDARKQGKLNYQQEHIAAQCEILVRGFARVGIVALVDEATGFQEQRDRNALAKFLEKFVADELRRWVKTFPLSYFRELCRLRGVELPRNMQLPQYFGHLTNDIVYSRLAPGVLSEIKRKAPTKDDGSRKGKLHQMLTEDIGHPKLLQHLGSVITLMKLSNDYDTFYKLLDQMHPVYRDMPLFAGMDDI
jgi:hypothetical protein